MERMTAAEYLALQAKQSGKPWSNATISDCAAGHRHASKLEARVCDRLTIQCAEDGTTLLQQPRFPLLALAPGPRGRPLYFTPDWAIWGEGKLLAVLDAKGRVSPEWVRGAAAFEATYGIAVTVVTK